MNPGLAQERNLSTDPTTGLDELSTNVQRSTEEVGRPTSAMA